MPAWHRRRPDHQRRNGRRRHQRRHRQRLQHLVVVTDIGVDKAEVFVVPQCREILEVAGVPTDTFEQFVFAWARATPVNGSIPAKRWRNQAEQTISLPPFPGVRLRAASAEKTGTSPVPVYDGTKDYLGSWTQAGAYLQWSAVNIAKPDSYLVLIEQAMAYTPHGHL